LLSFSLSSRQVSLSQNTPEAGSSNPTTSTR
jgi:hypothetical protein